MKVCMDLVGLRDGAVRPPLPDLRPDEHKELSAMMKRWAPVL